MYRFIENSETLVDGGFVKCVNSIVKSAASKIGSRVTITDVSVTVQSDTESHPLNSADRAQVVSDSSKLPGLTSTSSI